MTGDSLLAGLMMMNEPDIEVVDEVKALILESVRLRLFQDSKA